MPTPARASLMCFASQEKRRRVDQTWFLGIKSLGSMAHADDRAKSTNNVTIEFVEQIETAYHGALVYRQLVWQGCS
jgi:hypothetical protein